MSIEKDERLVERGFFETSLWVRVGIALLLTAALLFFLYFRTVPLKVVELGSTSEVEIVAPISFEVPDEEATALARQAARQSVGPIYRLNPEQIEAERQAVEKQLESDQSWRSQLPSLPLEQVDDLLERFSEGLAASRTTSQGTIDLMGKLKIEATHYYPFVPEELSKPTTLPSGFWSQLEEGLEAPPAATVLIVGPFQSQLWQMQEDHAAQRSTQKIAQEEVRSVMRTVPAGTRLLDRGELVTSQHVVAISALQSRMEMKGYRWDPTTFAGALLLTLLFIGAGGAYLRSYHPKVFRSNKQLFLITTVTVLTLALAKVVEVVVLRMDSHLADALRYPLFVPFTAILLCSLINGQVAALASAFVAIALVITLPVAPVPFLIINLLTALVAILKIQSLRRRKEVFAIAAKGWLCSALVVIGFHLYAGTLFPVSDLLVDLLATFLFMLFTAILVIGLLPLLESFFSVVTDITLMEFMDPAHPLLRRLALEAPGTYHHSIVLGNMTEAAATAIGANGLFCRAATLYHDVGKLANPQFFTENQHGGLNIHQLLTPLESTQVILGHVTEGVALARKYNLPEPFIDVIQEHHGTTLVYYFYRKQLELMEGDENLVNEADFRYPGPKPRSKESAIVMIADSIEAASRSLDELSEERVRALIDRIVAERMEEGQFDDSPLTFQELQIVKDSIAKTLLIASHSRIKYPVRPPQQERDG